MVQGAEVLPLHESTDAHRTEPQRLSRPRGWAGLAPQQPPLSQDPSGLESWGPAVPKDGVSLGSVQELSGDSTRMVRGAGAGAPHGPQRLTLRPAELRPLRRYRDCWPPLSGQYLSVWAWPPVAPHSGHT